MLFLPVWEPKDIFYQCDEPKVRNSLIVLSFVCLPFMEKSSRGSVMTLVHDETVEGEVVRGHATPPPPSPPLPCTA